MFAFFLILSFVSAVEIDMDSDLKKGENILAKISGTFLNPLTINNIYFYKDDVNAAFDFELIFIDGDYYISSSTFGKPSGNYSLVIEDAEHYIEGGQTSQEEIVKEFQIIEEFAPFTVSPALVIADGPFSLELRNIKAKSINISLEKNPEKSDTEQGFFSFFSDKEDSTENKTIFTLKSGEEKIINLDFTNVSNKTFQTLELEHENFTSEVLVYVIYSEQPKKEIKKFEFDREEYSISMTTNSNKSIPLFIENQGTVDFNNVTFTLSDNLKEYANLTPKSIEYFDSNSTYPLTLNISSKSQAESLNGSIKAITPDGLFEFTLIKINISEEFIPKIPEENESTNDTISVSKSCEELGGVKCNKSQYCPEEYKVDASDGECCLSSCKEKQTSSTGKVIGWAIIILLTLLFIWFYLKKYKKVKSTKDILDIAEKRNKPKTTKSKRGKFDTEE